MKKPVKEKKQKRESEFYIEHISDYLKLYCIPSNRKKWMCFAFFKEAFTFTLGYDVESVSGLLGTTKKITKEEFLKAFHKLAHKTKKHQNLINEYLSITEFILD